MKYESASFFNNTIRDRFFSKVENNTSWLGLFKEEVYKSVLNNVSIVIEENLSDNFAEIYNVKVVRIKTYFFVFKIAMVENDKYWWSSGSSKLLIKYEED